MRTIRAVTTLLLALSLAGPSHVAIAQDAAVGEPAAVLGWVLDETPYLEGESGEVGDKYVREGVAYAYLFDATDSRLDGQAIWTGNGYRYPTDPLFEVQSASWEITNDEGGWVGSSTALVGNGLGDTETAVLAGIGAYEGLTAVLVLNWSRAGASFRGAIFPGELPPAP